MNGPPPAAPEDVSFAGEPQSAYRIPPLRLAVASLSLVLVAFIGGATVAQLLNPGFGVWFSEVFIFFGLPFVLVRLSGRDPLAWTGLKMPATSTALFGFAVGAANFFALAIPLQLLAVLVFPKSWSETFDSSRIFEDRSPFDLALILTGVTIAAPIGEEFFFRGVFQNAISQTKLRLASAIVLTAAIFSAFHFDPVGFAARLELGVVFGWLFWRTKSIWPGVMAHAANNAITSVLFFVSKDDGAGKAAEAAAAGTTREELLQAVLFAAVGLMAFGALLLAAQKKPSLLAPMEAPERTLPPRGFFSLAAPWAIAATLSVGALFAFDWRGIQLNVFDAAHPLPERADQNPIEVNALSDLRSKARTGSVPIDEYEARRKALIERYGSEPQKKPATPKPPTIPPKTEPAPPAVEPQTEPAP